MGSGAVLPPPCSRMEGSVQVSVSFGPADATGMFVFTLTIAEAVFVQPFTGLVTVTS